MTINKAKYKLFSLVFVTAMASLFVFGSRASAATITVATGNDETTVNSSCSLSEAIQNINDQAATNSDCAAGDGNNDTVTIPAGTVTLTANLPHITESVTIQGAGMGQTIIDGDNSFNTFNINNADAVNLEGLTIVQFPGRALQSYRTNLMLEQLEVDGSNSPATQSIIELSGDSGTTLDVNNLYMHDVSYSSADAAGMFIPFSVNGDFTATVSNSTISNVASASSVNVMYFEQRNIVSTVVIQNVTIENVEAALSMNGIVTTSFANGVNTLSNTELLNVTFAHMRGTSSIYGDSSVFTATGSGRDTGDVATANIYATNVLLADITVPSSAGNDACRFFDGTSLFGGSGTAAGSVISRGGNVSDSNICSSAFNHPTDQNNITNLAASLLPLANNGGYVPTMALTQSSSAVDAGVTVAGLTTDARDSVRPQGLAYDSGAYESSFTALANPNPTPEADGGPAATDDSAKGSLAETGQELAVMLMAAGALLLGARRALVRATVYVRR